MEVRRAPRPRPWHWSPAACSAPIRYLSIGVYNHVGGRHESGAGTPEGVSRSNSNGRGRTMSNHATEPLSLTKSCKKPCSRWLLGAAVGAGSKGSGNGGAEAIAGQSHLPWAAPVKVRSDCRLGDQCDLLYDVLRGAADLQEATAFERSGEGDDRADTAGHCKRGFGVLHKSQSD